MHLLLDSLEHEMGKKLLYNGRQSAFNPQIGRCAWSDELGGDSNPDRPCFNTSEALRVTGPAGVTYIQSDKARSSISASTTLIVA